MTATTSRRYIIRRGFYGDFRVVDLVGVTRDQLAPNYTAARATARTLEARALALANRLENLRKRFLSPPGSPPLDPGRDTLIAADLSPAGAASSNGAGGPPSPSDRSASTANGSNLPPRTDWTSAGGAMTAGRLFPKRRPKL